MRVQNWMLPMAGLLGALAAVVAVLVAMGGTSDGSGDGAAATQERCAAGAEACDDSAGGDAFGTCLEGAEACDDSGGGSALGICIEGAVDCVDTVVNPNGDASDGADQPLPDDDQPVSNDPNNGGLGNPNDCSADPNAESCAARATELALADLSGRIGVEIEAITVVNVETATWDGCLGIPPAEGEACTEIGILGYKIILEHAGAPYEYHTDSGTQAVLLQ